MKNIAKILNIGALVIAICISSCQKETDKFIPYSNSDFSDTTWSNGTINNLKIDAILAQLSKPTLKATFSATTNATNDFDSTTQLQLPANACSVNGANYLGDITATLTPILLKGDFIRNLIPSTNEQPLQENVAAYHLSLTSTTNATLDIKANNKFNINYANNNFPAINYNYYYGTTNANNKTDITWNAADTNTGSLLIANATIQGNSKLAYQINSNKQGWMIINRNVNLGIATTCNVLLPINFTNKNTMVFAVFKNNNIVTKLNANAQSKSFVANNLPINSVVTFIALSYLDNQFYVGYTMQNITPNAQYNIKTTTTPISLSSLNSFLDGL
jgi:hypothetical protein